ncbi:hypothetical protein ABVT39_017663 [Epinephelus coioides]
MAAGRERWTNTTAICPENLKNASDQFQQEFQEAERLIRCRYEKIIGNVSSSAGTLQLSEAQKDQPSTTNPSPSVDTGQALQLNIQTLNHPPSTNLIRYLLSRPDPEPVAGPSYAGACPESLNPAANTSNQGDGAPVTAQHLKLTAELRNQLHFVPPLPFRRLVHSLPLNLRKRLRRVRHGTYVIRKEENKRMHKAHLHRLEQQVLDLRGQVRELTQARDTLQQQLNAYEATQEEVDALKGQLATYRRLRMPTYGFEGL